MVQFNDSDAQKVFNNFNTYTQDDAHKVMDNADKIQRIVCNETLSKFMTDVRLYFRMLSDVFSRRYTRVPKGTVAAIVGTLLYVLSPVDLIPDVLPVVGYLDDAAVLALCLKFAKHDVEEYKRVMGIK